MPKTAIFLKSRRFLGVFGGLNPPPHHRICKLTPLPPLAATPRQAHKGLATPLKEGNSLTPTQENNTMRTQLTKIVLAAAFGLALAFTFSCSSDTGGGGTSSEPTYFYSEYKIKNSSRSALETLESNAPTNPSFEDIEAIWSKIRELDSDFLRSGKGMTGSELRDMLVRSDATPKEANDTIERLNKRGNIILGFNRNLSTSYYMKVMYLERE